MKFYTENCIVTGKPATCWTGHVIMDNALHPDGVEIIAGYADVETMNKHCLTHKVYKGEWKPADGLMLIENGKTKFIMKTLVKY